MPFGMYRGESIADLPDDYLGWLLTIDLRPWLRAAVRREIDERAGHAEHERQQTNGRHRPCPAPAIAEELIGVGLRTIARRYHPDAGGTHEQMIQATAAADWLRDLVRGLPA